MKKSFLAIAITAALFPLTFSMEANAATNPKAAIEESIILGPATGGGGTGAMYLNGIRFNGWRLNGIRFNGWHLNGMKFQGTSTQAAKLQGMELQSLKVEGGQLVAVTRVAAQE